uniref:Uncharacterized protein n=1 Tax=Rhizophora mucronata TaxID=61149 RepID=A0A2P2K9W4_RHIMU
METRCFCVTTSFLSAFMLFVMININSKGEKLGSLENSQTKYQVLSEKMDTPLSPSSCVNCFGGVGVCHFKSRHFY